MKRAISGFILGIPITFLLFVLMSTLIETKAEVTTPPSTVPPRIEPVIYDKEVIRTPPIRKLPEPEPLINKPQTISEPTDSKNDRSLNPPTIFSLIGKGIHVLEIPTGIIDGSPVETNRDAQPELITQPEWPHKATTGGSVRLCFTVLPNGRATNVVIENAEPGRVFVKSAKRAVYRWKFKPAYIDGKAVQQENMCYTMKFELEG